MKVPSFRDAALVTAALAAVIFTGCHTIGTIRDNPRDYVGRTVMLRGEVTTARSVPFVETSIITVEDRSGALAVLSDEAWTAGQRYRGRVRIAGIATDEVERDTAELVDEVAGFLTARGIVSPQRASRTARAVVEFASRVLTSLDVSLVAVER